jgi:transcriptional regulator GlxA family with amidase domain
MRSVHRAAHDQSALTDRVALRAFVDACQVLVGQLDGTREASTALMRLILMRVLRRAGRSSPRHATNFRVARILRYLEDTFADPTIRLASAAQHVDVTPPYLDRLLKEHTGLTFLQ